MLNALLEPVKSKLRAPYRRLRRNYTRWRYGFGSRELLSLLRETGIEEGNAIFVHSAMSGFEGFHGSVLDIVDGFQKSVGRDGTLLMPTLSMTGSAIDFAKSGRVFDPRTTPSQVGMLTEIFRRSAGVKRSVHPTHSVCAWGNTEGWCLETHYLADSPCGSRTPFSRLYESGGKIVFAGVSISCMTFFHYAEEVLENRMPFSPFTEERYTMRCRVNQEIIETAPMRLYAPGISRRRRLLPLAEAMQSKARWKESRVGSLSVIVLDAREIMETLAEMADTGVFCYGP